MKALGTAMKYSFVLYFPLAIFIMWKMSAIRPLFVWFALMGAALPFCYISRKGRKILKHLYWKNKYYAFLAERRRREAEDDIYYGEDYEDCQDEKRLVLVPTRNKLMYEVKLM